MNRLLNHCVAVACALLFFTLQSSSLVADDLQEDRAEADQYYQAQKYYESYKIYSKLAKKGDHHSQEQLATMLARGEGTSTDLIDAYAWSMLAAQGGDETALKQSDDLLSQIGDKSKAEKKAAKLNKKYSDRALKEQADKRERMKRSHEMGGCTGGKLGCSQH